MNDRIFGDVAAALLTPNGSVFTGVCIDTPSWGLCAERTAVGSMVTAGEYRIERIVAVWQEWEGGRGELYVLPPCGHCREFMLQIHPDNRTAEVVLGTGQMVPLGDLLPHSTWPEQPARFEQRT